MDFKVIVMPKALRDLKKIADRIGQDEGAIAERFGNELIDQAFSVGMFPKIGRKVPEFNDPTIREVSHPPSRIIYRLRESTRQIHILRFWHAARGWPSL